MGEPQIGGSSTPASSVIRRQLPLEDDEPEVDLAELVAELEDKDTRELGPLYSTIDHLVKHLFTDPPSEAAQARIEFTYEGYRITVAQDGMVAFRKIA